jgi:hypothetical protein
MLLSLKSDKSRSIAGVGTLVESFSSKTSFGLGQCQGGKYSFFEGEGEINLLLLLLL